MTERDDTSNDRSAQTPPPSDTEPGAETGVRWIDLVSPTRDELLDLQRRYGFHHLAVEDALKRRQRPKVDVYATHLFVVLYALRRGRDGGLPESHEVTLFVTSSVVITIRAGDVPELDIAAHRWAEHCRETPRQSAAMLVYTIVDSIVDSYFPVVDDLAEEIESLEAAMFRQHGRDTLERIFELKRALLDLRRVVSPARDVFNVFIRRELPVFGADSIVYFQDVYDHVIRVTDAIDADRDILSSAVDVHISLQSNEMNQTVRTLTAASIVLMSLALVAGIYGMNFPLTPSQDDSFGFWFAIGLMVVLGGALTWLFRQRDWW